MIEIGDKNKLNSPIMTTTPVHNKYINKKEYRVVRQQKKQCV